MCTRYQLAYETFSQHVSYILDQSGTHQYEVKVNERLGQDIYHSRRKRRRGAPRVLEPSTHVNESGEKKQTERKS